MLGHAQKVDYCLAEEIYARKDISTN